MLTKLHLKNFKAWKDTGSIRLAPLTVIFGANSAGKSSLGHWLLALKQTAQSTDRKRALHFGHASTLIDLGTFADCMHGHDTAQPLDFALGWQLPKPMEVRDPLRPAVRYVGDRLGMDVSAAGKSGGARGAITSLPACRWRWGRVGCPTGAWRDPQVLA